MTKKYYIAYGSNLNIVQMRRRCPDATILGTAELHNMELLFKGSKSGSYLTIERAVNSYVPAVIWSVSESDEAALDRYEGYPHFYEKQEMEVRYKGIRKEYYRTIPAFIYIMHKNSPIGVPSGYYMKTCLDGYDTFGFDKKVLVNAYLKCKEMVDHENR